MGRRAEQAQPLQTPVKVKFPATKRLGTVRFEAGSPRQTQFPPVGTGARRSRLRAPGPLGHYYMDMMGAQM